jgi:hypothetical protein
MDVSGLYTARTVGILCPDNVVGKVLLRKLILLVGHLLKKIIIFDNHSRKEHLSPSKLYEQLIDSDPLFRGVPAYQMAQMKQHKISIITIPNPKDFSPHPAPPLETIDILFNCHIPCDFTRSNIEHCLNSHIWKAKQFSQFLNGRYSIEKLVLISSLYSQNYGYVSESDAQVNLQPLGYLPKELVSPAKLK